MGLKHNSILELKSKLVQSLKVLSEGKGAKRKLEQTIVRPSKQENHDTIDKTTEPRESNGMDIFGGTTFVKRKHVSSQPEGNEVNVDDEEVLNRDSLSEKKTEKLEEEKDLKSLVNPEGNLFHRRI